MNYIKREIVDLIIKRFKSRNIISIIGPRQTGKTTLCKEILPSMIKKDFEYYTFDDPDERLRFSQNSLSILKNTKKQVVIFDEIQKAPFMFESLKYAIDNYDKNIKYLITGSSQILLMKNIKETLAGRISLFNLYPFSVREICANNLSLKNENLLSQIVNNKIKNMKNKLSEYNLISSEIIRSIKEIINLHKKFGGLPPIWFIDDNEEKFAWLKDYRRTYIERDLRDVGGFSNIEDLNLVHKLLSLRTAQVLNMSNISKESGLSVNTVKKYIKILKIGLQIDLLQPFYSNVKKRLVKSPKIYFLDTGVLWSIVGESGVSDGVLFENWVYAEILKHRERYFTNSEIYFFRSSSSREVDFIIKNNSRIVAIEVKLTKNPDTRDSKNIRVFFKEYTRLKGVGIIVYPGDKAFEVEKNIYAIPDWILFCWIYRGEVLDVNGLIIQVTHTLIYGSFSGESRLNNLTIFFWVYKNFV